MKKLTPKQQRFVQEYLIDLNGRQAAIRAGYAPGSAEVTASRLLIHANVGAAVKAAVVKREERTGITQDWVLNTIYETAERCKQARPVLDRKGDPVMVETPSGAFAPAYAFDPGSVLRAAELGGRHLNLFPNRHEITGKDGGPIEVDDARERLSSRILGVASALAASSADSETKH